jgi:hypothetical protein
MSHTMFVALAYGLTVLAAGWLGIGAWRRMGAARRKLAAIDPRGERGGERT